MLEAFQRWPDQGSTRKWLPNLDFECPYWHSIVHGTNKSMEPGAIVTFNNKYEAAPPSQTNNYVIDSLTTSNFLLMLKRDTMYVTIVAHARGSPISLWSSHNNNTPRGGGGGG